MKYVAHIISITIKITLVHDLQLHIIIVRREMIIFTKRKTLLNNKIGDVSVMYVT